MQSDFAQTLAMGIAVEEALTAWLQSCGYTVLPIAQAGGKGIGPKLFFPDDIVTVPDLLVLLDDGPIWLESKAKTGFNLHRKSGHWVTGIDIRHYENYLRVMERTGWDVWLVFLSERPEPGAPQAGIYTGRLTELREREHHRWTSPKNQYGKGGMVYWADDTLQYLATLDEVNAAFAAQKGTRWLV